MSVYTHFSYMGRNPQTILAKLSRANIEVLSVKKTERGIDFKCRYKDERKVFAIFGGAWYNIKAKGHSGFMYPLVYLLNRKGVILGAVLFLALILFSQSLIFSVEVEGADIYKAQVLSVLDESGIKPFSSFRALNKKRVESKVASIEGISFVSLKRQGNRVVLEVRLSGQDALAKARNYNGLFAPSDCKVVSLTVLRGTKLCEVGALVKKGELLVGAYLELESGERAQTFIICSVEIEAQCIVEFVTPHFSAAAESAALAYAKFILGEQKKITDYTIAAAAKGGEKVLKVTCKYIQKLTEG